MTVRTKPGKNGDVHQSNGHAARGVIPPLDAVSTVADPKPAGDEKPATEGRTAKGTFAPGNTFARGNPVARRMASLRAALLEAATAERMKALGEKLYAAALDGDWTAAKLLLAYAVGKAPEAVDPDRLDLDEWRLLDAAPTPAQMMRALLDVVPPNLASEFLQSLQPADEAALKKKLHFMQDDDDDDDDDGASYARGMRIMAEVEARVGK